MKKATILAVFAAAAALALHGESLSAVDLAEGECPLPVPSRAVMLHAISTNATGTVTLKKVTTLAYSWMQLQTVTNIAYTTAYSNLTHAVTNDIVSAWRTNAVGTAVQSNFLARAVNALPSVYPWPDLLFTTNEVVTAEVYTNIPYQVEAERKVMVRLVPRSAGKVVTNDLCSVTLSGGFKTNAVNAVFAPGDVILGSGTAFKGGRVQLIISK